MTPSAENFLQVRGLVAGYGRKEVVHGVDMHVGKGEILVVLGHNGAGKTTTMSALFGLVKPHAGAITLDGRDISAADPADNVRSGFAYVPQGHRVFKSLSVRKNLELGAFAVSRDRPSDLGLDSVFDLFPILKERERQIAGTLSGGQQQMLAIGMALMNKPTMLILDEPSIGLAPKLVERVMQSVKAINERFGVTILMVEQNVPAGLSIAHRVAIMKTGKIIYDGDPAPLHDHVLLMTYF